MAVNPLFSGPGQSSRNRQPRLPPVYHSQNNYQFTSSLHTQEFEGMDSAVPRKKLRLNSGGTMDTDQDEDPFEDFEESFTADDLDAIDMIASQALSQAPPNSANSFRKVGSSTSSRHPSVKQFNNAKAQQGRHPSNGAKVESPVAPNVLRPREHPVQTNLNIPFHQLKNRPVKTPANQVIGNNFSKKKSAGGGVDGNVRDELTPPKGTTAVDSSARPGGPQDEFSPVQKLQQEVERYKAETEHLNQKLNALKSEKCRKNGEIEVLRQNLTKAQTDISKLQIERIQKDEEKQREQANKEKQLEREVEALKTQLEFKDREIIETQTSLRNLQQRSNSNCPSPRKSPRLVPVSSPSKKAFPTKSSFMTGSTKQQQHNQRSPVAAKGSPLKNQSRPTKTKSPGSSVSPRRTSSGLLIKKWNPPAIGTALQLKTRVLNGCMTPSVMIGLLMKNEEEAAEVKKSQSSSNLFDMFSGGNQADSVEPQDVSQDLTSSSAQRIACEAISSLLSSGNHEAQSLSLPLPNHPMVPTTPALSEHHLAKLIPVIQNQLDHYLQELESLMEKTRSCTTVSQSTSHPDIEEQHREETVVECRSKMLVPGLRSLRKLCCHSESICKMITAGCDQIQNAMDTSADEIDPSAPITFTQSSSRGRSSSDHLCLAEWMKEPCRIVQLLQEVLKLHPVKGHPCQTVRESGWGVISALCRNSGDSELKWCIPFLVQDGFLLALSATISTMDTYKSAIAVATAVARSVSVCSQSDSCPLSHIYQLVTSVKSSGDNSDHEITAVRHELIGLLLTIVSSQVNGANSLVETNCHCTFEVVSSVVFIMLEELKLADIDKEVTQRRWFLLKQGLLFLHVVIIQTRAIAEQKVESEMELMNLVVGLHRFFRRVSEMDKSLACMLQDIWECVAGDDDVWEEDELEDENEMMQQD